MAIGDSAGLLFRIRADGSQAKRELADIRGDVGALGGGLSALGGPAAIGAAAIAAIGTAAVAAAASIFRLTTSAAEYGSEIFDAMQKTGLAAETISALRYAAEQSGSSFESITNAVSKFNVLIGQAEAGSEKAQKTLEKYKITTTDTDKALAQAITTIAKMTSTSQQAAAAAALFKDRTGEILPVIKSFDGDLPGLMAKLRELGVLMSDEDARAADEFADTLSDLERQAGALGRQFATELMPMMVNAMNAISRAMAENKGEAVKWGQTLSDVAYGVPVAFQTAVAAIEFSLGMLGVALKRSADQSKTWGDIILAGVLGPMGVALAHLGHQGGVSAGIGVTGQAPSIPTFRGGGGGGRGGGGGGQNEAEQKRKQEVAEAERVMRQKLEIFRVGTQEQERMLDEQLSRNEISEMEHLERVRALKENEVRYEALLLKNFSQNKLLNDKEEAEAKHKLNIATAKVRIEELETQIEINKQDAKHVEFLQRAKADLEKIVELEKERLQKARERRQELEFEDRKRRLQQDRQDRIDAQRATSGDSGEFGQLFTMFEGNQAATAGIEAMKLAFEGLAQAIGQAVSAWVLYGNAGTSARKVAAQIIASIAQMATVKAIFELAEGFAALARSFFGDPKAAAEAAMHFKAAATYGIIAGIAAVAGRGVAGNSFNEATGGGGRGGSSEGQGNRPGLNFTEHFAGFREQNQRMAIVMGGVSDELRAFREKFGPVTPGHVVMAGAGEAPGAIFDAVQTEMADNYKAPTLMRRNQGDYR